MKTTKWTCEWTTMVTGQVMKTKISGKTLSEAIDKLCKESRVGSILRVVDSKGVEWL